jgi:hypothetical protein
VNGFLPSIWTLSDYFIENTNSIQNAGDLRWKRKLVFPIHRETSI